MSEDQFLAEIQAKRAEAASEFTQAQDELQAVAKRRNALQAIVEAYDTIIEKTPTVDQPAVGAQPLPGIDQALSPGSNVAPERGAWRLIRQIRFGGMTNRQAIDVLRAEFGKAGHADDYASAIYVINSVADLARAKRTVNNELWRAVKRHELQRVGRGLYASIMAPDSEDGGNEA